MLFANTEWSHIERLRDRCNQQQATSLQAAAQEFAGLFADEFESVVLARVFAVFPFGTLPKREETFVLDLVRGDTRLGSRTPVLTLLGTRGVDASWNDRTTSRGHLAIPLLDRSFVQGAPMIAKLLSDLDIDMKNLDNGQPIATRQMLGGRNSTFYVSDGQSACDAQGRNIIPAREFVAKNHVRTVFGMGGAYVDGTLILAIVFTRELLERLVVERFPSLISNFKMATAELVTAKQLFADV